MRAGQILDSILVMSYLIRALKIDPETGNLQRVVIVRPTLGLAKTSQLRLVELGWSVRIEPK